MFPADLPDALAATHGLGTYSIDAAGVITGCDESAAALLGWKPEQLLGRRAHDVFHRPPADDRPSVSGDCLIHRAPHQRVTHCELDTFWTSHGSPVDVWWTAAPVDASSPAKASSTCVVVFGLTAGALSDRPLSPVSSVTRASHDGETDFLLRLSQLSDVLTTMDVAQGLCEVARLAATTLADWCVIDRIDGERIERAALSHHAEMAAPGVSLSNALAARLRRMPDLTEKATGTLAQILSGQQDALSISAAELPDATDALDAAQQSLFDDLGALHIMLVPLRSGARIVGAMTWVRTTGAPFGKTERLIADMFGTRVGRWLDNLRLTELQARMAEQMQRSLLSTPPTSPGVQISVRYQAANENARIGGDWHDSFLDRHGGTTIVIGDVAGHDTVAAVNMAQLRSILRLAALNSDQDPARSLSTLDQALPYLTPGVTATAIVGILQPPGRDGSIDFRWSNAGHLPPVLMHPDGTTSLLWTDADLLLGCAPGRRRSNHERTLRPGSVLLLYTDGLIERPDEPIDVSLERLRDTLAQCVSEKPVGDDLMRMLIDRLAADLPTDDVAVVGVVNTGLGAGASFGEARPALRLTG